MARSHFPAQIPVSHFLSFDYSRMAGRFDGKIVRNKDLGWKYSVAQGCRPDPGVGRRSRLARRVEEILAHDSIVRFLYAR